MGKEGPKCRVKVSEDVRRRSSKRVSEFKYT
jgi:hypothetical protein